MRILHVSDIHYRESADSWSLLKEAGQQFELLRPDLILITGDLTNDGLDEQFQRVKRFISGLNFCPVLVIPGNRDQSRTIAPAPVERSDLEYFMLTHPDPVTLFDEIESPESVNYGRQGKYFDHFDSTEFFYRDKGIAAAGVNSTPDITLRQIENVTQHFNKGPAAEFRIFCAHHSFMPVPTKKLRAGDIVPRSADILQSLIELNVNLLCCGHIHRSHVWELSDGRHRLLCCNAGSLLDTSGKKDNGYLEIEVGLDVRITKRTLFSDRTEVLYHRLPAPRNSSVIKSNQYLQSLNNNGAPKQLTSEHDAGESRSKLKKAKGKR